MKVSVVVLLHCCIVLILMTEFVLIQLFCSSMYLWLFLFSSRCFVPSHVSFSDVANNGKTAVLVSVTSFSEEDDVFLNQQVDC